MLFILTESQAAFPSAVKISQESPSSRIEVRRYLGHEDKQASRDTKRQTLTQRLHRDWATMRGDPPCPLKEGSGKLPRPLGNPTQGDSGTD